MKISARNQLKGTVKSIALGVTTAKVTVHVGGSLSKSVMTRRSVQEPGLAVGSEATAVIESTEVMLMVD